MLSLAAPPWLPTTSISAPIEPRKIPPTFIGVTGSFRKSAASTMVMSGIVVVMIEASMGEVSDSPKVKHP